MHNALAIATLAALASALPVAADDAPAPRCPAWTVEDALAIANALRQGGLDCGARGMQAPAPPLHWSESLQPLASAQAAWLAAPRAEGEPGASAGADGPALHHTDARGRSLGARAAAAGLAYARIGENLAWGQTSLNAVLQSWAASDGHCANLADPGFSAAALACAPAADGQPVWVMVLARLRPPLPRPGPPPGPALRPG